MLSSLKHNLRNLVTLSVLGFSVLLTSCGEQGEGENVKLAGITGPTVQAFENGLQIKIIFDNLVLQGGLSYPIPQYFDSYIELGTDIDSGKSMLRIYVSYEDIFKNETLRLADPQSLPGGRPLPGIGDSPELPAVAAQIPQFNDVTVYLSKKYYGLFIPLNVGFQGLGAYYSYKIQGKHAGIISLVGEDNSGENSGLFFALKLDSAIAKALKKRVL